MVQARQILNSCRTSPLSYAKIWLGVGLEETGGAKSLEMQQRTTSVVEASWPLADPDHVGNAIERRHACGPVSSGGETRRPLS